MSRLLPRYLMGFALLMLALLWPLLKMTTHAQDDTGTVTVSEVRADFPRIELDASVIRQGRAISGLTAASFSIGEPNRDLTVEEIGTSSILAVVIDTPDQLLGDELARVKEAVRLYFSDPALYEDGATVIIVQQFNRTYTPRTFNNRSDILSYIEGIGNGSGINRYEDGLQSAANALSDFLADNGGTGNILIVGAFAQAGTADLDNTAALAQALFAERGFTTSTIHAFTGSRQRFTAGYQTIAELGNGQSAVFNLSAAPLVLNDVYDHIRGDQSAYRLTYESLDATPGLHTVTLTATTDDGTTISGQFEYIGPNLIAPVVTVQGITNNETIFRNQDPTTGAFDNTTRTINVSITFPDGFERELNEVLLEVVSNGEVVDEISVSSPDGTTVEIDWNLSSIVPPAGQTSFTEVVTLNLRVIDQYSLVGQSNPISVVVQAEGVPGGVTTAATPSAAPPTTDTTEFITQTAVVIQQTIDAAQASALSPADLQATATAVAALSPEDRVATANAIAAASIAESEQAADAASDDGVSPIVIIGAGAVGVLAFFVLFVVLFGRRGRGEQPAPVVSNAGSNLDFMKTQVGFGVAPPAYLDILTGVESGKQVPLDASTFTIGRAAGQGINYATPAYDNVSSRHCSIIFRNNEYVIVDHGSTNGTFLNGRQLTPNIETPIPSSATIQLGKDPVTSIQMRFTVLGASGGLGDVGKTRIDVGVGPGPVDPNVWGNKTQLYGQQNQQQQAAPPPPPAGHPPAAAAPGQFFNPNQPQRPPAPPPPPQQGGQQGYGQQQRGYESDWSGGKKDDDSWLDQ